MKLVYSPRYVIDIGPHVYLTEKYRRIHERLLAAPHAHLDGTVEPEPATWNQLALVHTDEYLDKVRTLTLASEELRELQLPLNESSTVIVEALGNVGEFIGGIAVVITIAYLAVQIRRSSRIAGLAFSWKALQRTGHSAFPSTFGSVWH